MRKGVILRSKDKASHSKRIHRVSILYVRPVQTQANAGALYHSMNAKKQNYLNTGKLFLNAYLLGLYEKLEL